MSHLLILTAVKSLLCHLPHTASPHSTQPLPSLCLTWLLPLVSTPGCRLGHTLTWSPLCSDLCTAPCCPQSPSRGPPGLSTAWPHSPQHSTPTATHASAISRMCCFQAGRTSPTHLENQAPCGVMSFSKQDFLFANSLSWGPHPKENYLLLTLTPRHSQDPSDHGEAP